MAQMNSLRKLNTTETPTTPRARTSPTFEQLLQGKSMSLLQYEQVNKMPE